MILEPMQLESMESIDALNQMRDFKRLATIGKGPISIVYKCLNKIDNLIYAIKKITCKIYGNSILSKH